MTESDAEGSELARVHVWVTGRVQGVGFRFFVEDSARIIGVSGWVRNVGYDTVEAVAEGTQAQVDQFVQMMKRGPSSARVDECRVNIETPAGEFQDFQMRYSR